MKTYGPIAVVTGGAQGIEKAITKISFVNIAYV